MISDLYSGQSKVLEYKAELPQKSEKYLKTVVAFSNGQGGKLLIGVDDKNLEIIGVEEKSGFRIMDSIANAIADACCPQIIPNITFQNVQGKCIVIVEIYPGANRPYYLKSLGKENGTYIRMGATTRKADPSKIKELELEGANVYYDEMVCTGYPLQGEAINRLCADIESHMRESADRDDHNTKKVTVENLISWKVIKDIEGVLYPTNGFVLLTSDYFPFAKIQCALFKGVDRDIFIDKKEYKGSLYEQIEGAYQFVLSHINLGAEIEGLVRRESYELPVTAIREMIVNAVCHRNYMDSSSVQVAIYDDRVEVTSPGMLYGLTLEEALSGRSKIRNRAIAEVFSRMGIIEEWGTGIRRIKNRAAEYGLSEPDFLEIGDSFRVNLYRTKQNKPIEADKKPIEADKKPKKEKKKSRLSLIWRKTAASPIEKEGSF